MDRQQAAKEFAKVLSQRGIEGSIKVVYRLIQRPIGPQKDEWTQLKAWYESLTDEQKRLFAFLVKQAMISAVFGLAVFFDGASEYHFVGEHPVDFAIAMQVYNNLDDAMEGKIEERIEVCPTHHGEDLHDILLNLIDDWEASPDNHHQSDDSQT